MADDVYGARPARHAPLFFFQAEDGIRDYKVTGVQTCALPISVPGLNEENQSRHVDGPCGPAAHPHAPASARDRKSTRLNSSHLVISYAVFCLKKKKNHTRGTRICTLLQFR